MPHQIYLDNHATTPCDPRVLESMLPFFVENFGNPSSTSHGPGLIAAAALEKARHEVAGVVGGTSDEVVFASGATECNNLAILGAARRHCELGGKRRRIVISSVEHKSVSQPCLYLAQWGWELVTIPVDEAGEMKLDLLEEAVTEETLLVSVQAANHEIGTIQPLKAIASISHEAGAVVHCDATQAVGTIDVDAPEWGVDLLTFSGHKIYGPKGVGALWLRGGIRHLPLTPSTFGGGQERGVRPGTQNVPAIVGLGTAASLCKESREVDRVHILGLRDQFERSLIEAIPGLKVNGSPKHKVVGNSSMTFPGVEAEALLANLTGVAASSGSACDSGAIEPSTVLTAIGLDRDEAFATIRFGFGRFNTADEVERAACLVADAYRTVAGS